MAKRKCRTKRDLRGLQIESGILWHPFTLLGETKECAKPFELLRARGFAALRAGGRASLLGIPTESAPLDLVNDVIFKGVTVQGIYGRRMYETWVQMTALLKGARLKLDPLFGEWRSFESFEAAFALLQRVWQNHAYF